MPEGTHQHQQQPQPPYFNNDDARELRSAQNLVIAASIMGPVSMIIGGVFLGTVGLVCGILALRKIQKLAQKGGPLGLAATRLRIACIVALVVTAIALVLNVISIVLIYPLVVEALQTGDYSKILPQGGLPSGGSDSGGSSAWG